MAAGFKICLLSLVLAEPFTSVSSFLPSALSPSSLLRKAPAPQALPLAVQEAEVGVEALPAQSSFSGVAFAATPNVPAAGNSAGAGASPAQNNLTLDAMNRRQEELNRREQVLRSLEQELDGRLEQMQALETRLQTMLKDAEEARDEKYKHLVDVLSNMKSRQAAEVLESLDEKIAVKVLAGMRGRQAGEILTYAAPAKAARLTEALARMQLPLE